MPTDIIAGSTIASTSKGSLSAVLITSKAFVVAHPIGMAVTGGALLGIGGYVSLGKYLSNRKEKKALLKQAANNVVAAQAT